MIYSQSISKGARIPAAAPVPQHRIFRFTVDAQGKFSYDPPGDWRYDRNDTIDFSTRTGQFTIRFEPLNAPNIPGFNPLGGQLSASRRDDDSWVATTTVRDGLSDAQRDAIWNANKPENGDGFVAKYQYVIDVKTADGKEFHAQDHNGVFGC